MFSVSLHCIHSVHITDKGNDVMTLPVSPV